ncbi:hypothetical protein Tco_1226010 [Tanacetum coccineum]
MPPLTGVPVVAPVTAGRPRGTTQVVTRGTTNDWYEVAGTRYCSYEVVGTRWQGMYEVAAAGQSEHDTCPKRVIRGCKRDVSLSLSFFNSRNQVSSLSGEKSALTAEVSALKVACTEVGTKITSLASERDRLVSEVCPHLLQVSFLCAGFEDFKEKMEVQQEEQAQELYNRVAELEAHVMDVSGRLEGEFYPTYLTLLAGRRWLLTHGIQLALLKCLKSSEYQGILGHALGRAVDFGMQEGLEAGHEHGVAGRSLSVVDAYNPEVASADYVNAVKALEDAHFPLVDLLKSKKDAGMDEVLDCFLLDGPLAELPEAASLQPCIEQLSIPIHHAGDKTAVGETSLSFALMNVHARAEGAKKHAAALRQLMMEIVSAPLSSQTWVGEASISAAPLSVEDYAEEDTDEALGSVVAIFSLFCMPWPYVAISVCGLSTSTVRSVGMPIFAGMTASVSYVSENGVSPSLNFIMVRCAHRTRESSLIQSLLLSSNLALIPSPRLLKWISPKLTENQPKMTITEHGMERLAKSRPKAEKESDKRKRVGGLVLPLPQSFLLNPATHPRPYPPSRQNHTSFPHGFWPKPLSQVPFQLTPHPFPPYPALITPFPVKTHNPSTPMNGEMKRRQKGGLGLSVRPSTLTASTSQQKEKAES